MHISNLRKEFGSVVAVNNVSFTVKKPEFVGVIGRSGAGKSTLLRMINRLIEATGGSVEFEGKDVLQFRGKARRDWQRNCAMIFQQFNLVPRLDAITNVMLGRLNQLNLWRSLFRVFPEKDIVDALHNLERLGISEKALTRVEYLSGGQQQRVAIARALMQEPKLILADEPIASLDPLSAEIVMNSLREIHERDQLTVICNLHTLEAARKYCDRVIGMYQGQVVFDGHVTQLTQEIVREIYGAEELNEDLTKISLDDFQENHSKSANTIVPV
jgi:phosphonate transport system ATP-binding protein